jgi:integrase/recombinase XerD
MKENDGFFKYVRGFLTVFLPKNKCCSRNTIKAYRDSLNLFRRFLLEKKGIAFTQISFDLINHELVYEFLAWLQDAHGCGAATQNHRLAVLKSFLRYCAFEDPTLMAIYLDIQKVQSKKTTRKRVEYMSETASKRSWI